MNLTLIIMAAGMGSRYGGLKQLESVGPRGEIIMDYSVRDALAAGFNKVVFVINKKIEKEFREKIGSKTEKLIKTEYVFQESEIREKPFGTAHAVLCCRDKVNEPFAVINADDFYGQSSFAAMAEFLRQQPLKEKDGKYHFAMLGYMLKNTLTENGTVSRGICSVDDEGYLIDITERTKIKGDGSKIEYTENGADWYELPSDSPVSMNFWGFTPDIFAELDSHFTLFLREYADDLMKAEFYLPMAVSKLLKEKKADVKVLPTSEKWYGVTYKEDKASVVEAIKKMTEQGLYTYE